MTERTCPICQDSINLYACVIIGRCGHALCQTCWDNFKFSHNQLEGRKPPKCPSCRCLIHIPSIIQKEKIKYVKETFEQDLKSENQNLRNLLVNLTTYNRKEIGEWKSQYKSYLEKSGKLCIQESGDRINIEQEHAIEMLHYRNYITDFIRHHREMREALKRMTKEYVPPVLPRHPMPPDPVDVIPPEDTPYAPLPYQPFSYFGGNQHQHQHGPPIISSITVGQVGHNGPHTNPGAVLEDVRQIIANIQTQQNGPTIPQAAMP